MHQDQGLVLYPSFKIIQKKTFAFNEIKIKFQTKAFRYFQVFSKFAYYFLCTPFNIVKTTDGQLTFKSNSIQTFLCGLNHISTLLENFYRVWDAVYNRQSTFKDKPSTIYNLATEVMMAGCILTFAYLTWFKRKGFQSMYRSFNNLAHDNKPPKLWKCKEGWIVVFLCLLGMLDPIADQIRILLYSPDELKKIIGVNARESSRETSWNLILAIYVNQNVIPPLNWTIGILLRIFAFYTTSLVYLSLLVLTTIICIVIRQLSLDLERFLNENPNATWEEITGCYVQLKRFLNHLNIMYGPLMISYVAVGLVSFSMYLKVLLAAQDLHEVLLLTSSFVVFTGSLTLAAQANVRFQVLNSYIFDNRERFHTTSCSEISIVIHDLSSFPMGLKAQSFTITYGFIVSILSTVLTYFIVIIQFNISWSPPL